MRRDRRSVDVEHHEIAIVVDAGDRTLFGATIGEGDQRGAITKVVGVREHLAGGDHHAAAAPVLADADE